MASPRVWSRDDFLEAMRLATARQDSTAKNEAKWWAQAACDVLEFAERNATVHTDVAAEPLRDERGRFLPKPHLHLDSAVVTTARAGG